MTAAHRYDEVYEATPAEIGAVRARALALRARLDTLALHPGAASPFVAVTPLGLPAAARLRRDLEALGVGVKRRFACSDWAARSTALYLRAFDEADVVRAAAYEHVWRAAFAPPAEIWVLAGDEAYGRLVEKKYEVRRRFRSRRCEVAAAGARTEIRLHAFHLPDPHRVPIEWYLVNQADQR